MKTLRQDLSAEGRLDILSKVMPYRGGRFHVGSPSWSVTYHITYVGYSQEVSVVTSAGRNPEASTGSTSH